LHDIKQRLERQWALRPTDKTRADLYQEDARMRAREYTGYRHVAACAACDVQAVCDGFYGDYTDLFGEGDASPVVVGGRVADPQYYSRHQAKRVHPDDLAWLESEDASRARRGD
jgi:hypothetical protein